jgi:hypothetical protein
MDSSMFGLIELVLVFGIVLGLAVWELRSLRKTQARDREEAEAKARGEAD